MSDRQLPATRDVFAYWHGNKVHVALHGETSLDDRVTTLTAAQALRLAEQLVRSAREALAA